MMNLIEAVRSERPFRRPCFPEGLYYSYTRGGTVTQTLYRSDGEYYQLCREDVLADDYELQEATVTITASQFWEAYNQVGLDSMGLHSARPIVSAIARKLGLEPK